MTFVPLFCQSHFSPSGVAAPSDLVRRGRNLDYTTLGLCDQATIAGFHEFDQACRDQGIRPVFGCRLFMEALALTGLTFPIDFFIETEQGYRNLMRLLNLYHGRDDGLRHILTADEMNGRVHGLIAVIPPDGELKSLIEQRERSQTERFLKRSVELFDLHMHFGIDAILWPHAAFVRRLADFIGVRPLAAPAIRYPHPGDAAAAVWLDHRPQPPGRTYRPPEDLKSLPAMWPPSEVLAQWKPFGHDLVLQTNALARRCAWRPGLIRRAFPSQDLERGFDPNSYLFDLAIRGATQRYGDISESLKQRINRELEDVRAADLAPYLLLHEQIGQALDEKGIPRGVGRGRIVTSVLAYCLGISQIDPLQYRLAARSLKTAGESFPPINIEVPRHSVAQVLDWVREHFGHEHLLEIGRVQETRRDQMLLQLAEWSGMNQEEQRLIHKEKNRLRSAGAAQRLSELAETTRSRRWRDPAFLGDVAARLAPRPRVWVATGDRFALCGEPLDCMIPRIHSAQDRFVSGLEEPAIDKLGLARLVFVPHGLLDILDQGLKAAWAEDPDLEFGRLPMDNRAAFDLLGRGDTMGIPPLEGIQLRLLLRKNRPRNLLQLLRVKTEANTGHVHEGRIEMSDALPDVLLSYQCAYLKANHPRAFFAAVLDATLEQRANPLPLIRAARRTGIDILPPNINLSDWGASIQGEAIRLGLAAVRNVGHRVWANLHAVRSGGNFESLKDFCERIDTRLINQKALKSLIESGAMDCLDPNRARLDEMASRMYRRARERDREVSRAQAQTTLFDMDAFGEIGETSTPEELDLEEIQDWNRWEEIQREAEALGFHLSIDPIERYKIARNHLHPLSVHQLKPRHVGHRVRVTGLVLATQSGGPLLRKTGEVMVDLEGLPVLLSPQLARVCNYCLEPSGEALVIGHLSKELGAPCIFAEGIWKLADLEDQATKVAAIQLHLHGENRETLKFLDALARDFPGSTQLHLVDYTGRRGWLYRRLSKRGVFFCSPLYQGLCTLLSPENIRLFGQNGDPLVARAKQDEGEEFEQSRA